MEEKQEIVAINGLHFLPPECCNQQEPFQTTFNCVSCTLIKDEPGCCKVDCTWMPILVLCQIGLCGIVFELFCIRKRICIVDFCTYEKYSQMDNGQIQDTYWSLGKIALLIFDILNLVELFRIIENESCYDDVRQQGGEVFWTAIIIYSVVSACDIVLACILWCCSFCGCFAYKLLFQNGTKRCVVGCSKCRSCKREPEEELLELDTGATDV